MEESKTVGKSIVESLFDEGTFAELGAYIKRADGNPVGVVGGYGSVNGKLVYAFAQDSDRRKGAFDLLQAKKIAALYEKAVENGAPIVGVFDSAGTFVTDGTTAASAYGLFLKTVSDASGVIPQIAVIRGVCTGLSATVAATFDLCVTVKDRTVWSVNSPFLLGKEVGTQESTAANGMSSISAESEEEAVMLARKLATILPDSSAEGVSPAEDPDDANRAVDVNGLSGKDLIAALVDSGDFTEIGAGFGKGMITGLATFGGVICGIVASDPTVDGGALTCDGAKKAAKLIGFCDCFGIPVVTVVDSCGVSLARADEDGALAAQLGKLAMAYAGSSNAKITVVTGKAYGAAFTLLGSGQLGADLVCALPDAEISVMAPESAVAFLWNDRIDENTSRAALEEEWKKTVASPVSAAGDGSIDDVVDPSELRKRICSALYMLLCKSGKPARRHQNLPL